MLEFSQTVVQRASGDMDEFFWEVYSVRSVINPFLGLSVSLAAYQSFIFLPSCCRQVYISYTSSITESINKLIK